MAIGCVFVQNPEFPQSILRGPLAVAAVEHNAHECQQNIFGNLPSVTGSYAAHFEAGSNVLPSVSDVGLPAAHITMGDPRWHLIEFGSAKYGGDVPNPPYAPVRRGVDESGLRFVQE